MKCAVLLPYSLAALAAGVSLPTAYDHRSGVKWEGFIKDGVEAFHGIRFGQTTAGPNRFKPPQPYEYARNTTVEAQSPGPACPQALGATGLPLYLGNITAVSEDCLALNVNRPNGTTSRHNLPVMVYIHGGSFWLGSKDDLTSQPGGLILESVANGLPVIHVSVNYRLGVFGFASSGALRHEGSVNAGLLDQRLALEWVKRNIASFGGDPDNITIHGQSSGGLAVGMQIMAYGGKKPVPFKKAICQSQALEPGITGNFTLNAMTKVAEVSGCNTTLLDSNSTLSCLRALTMDALLTAETEFHSGDPSHNIGDEWLPTVDGNFLPAAPSDLIAGGHFANVSVVFGWCEDDTNPFVPSAISTANDTYAFFRNYAPGLTTVNLDSLLQLYPASEFTANPSANVTAELYRAGRILRDILMVCQPIYYAEALARQGGDVYLYDQNQTILAPILAAAGAPGLGVVHTSEMAYMFGNFSHFDIDAGNHPNATDYRLLTRESRSWSSFAALGRPSLQNHDTLQGWTPAFVHQNESKIFVIGGDDEGLSSLDGPHSSSAVTVQRLRERCDFLARPEIVKQLHW